MTNPHKFTFGEFRGVPPLDYVMCYRKNHVHMEPGDSWFTPIIDIPYGVGLIKRLHCFTKKILKFVFNYAALGLTESSLSCIFNSIN
jgi:hypothetical protein